jgi:hypothetical protein
MQEKSGIVRVLPWLPTVLGVAALVAFTILTIVRLLPEHSRTLPPPEPAFALPGTTSGSPAPVSPIPTELIPTELIPAASSATPAAVPTSATPSPGRSSAPARTIPAVIVPPRTTEPARPVTVSGQYHVLNSYDDSFIGEVLLTNHTSAGQNWVVTLTYAGNLRTSWLESLPQPTLVQRGHTFTWSSSVPLAAGSTGQLRFQFDKVGGSETPDACTVDGSPCT